MEQDPGGLTLPGASLAFTLLLYGAKAPALVVVAMVVNGYAAGSALQISIYLPLTCTSALCAPLPCPINPTLLGEQAVQQDFGEIG